MFYFWQYLAEEHNKNIFIYYGESCNRIGQADAMLGFGVKSYLCKAIVTDFFIQHQMKFLITDKKIFYVNLE